MEYTVLYERERKPQDENNLHTIVLYNRERNTQDDAEKQVKRMNIITVYLYSMSTTNILF